MAATYNFGSVYTQQYSTTSEGKYITLCMSIWCIHVIHAVYVLKYTVCKTHAKIHVTVFENVELKSKCHSILSSGKLQYTTIWCVQTTEHVPVFGVKRGTHK